MKIENYKFPPPRRVAILGLGLMGGSLGLALKRGGFRGRVQAYARRPETRAQALRAGAADEVFESPAAAVRGADLVVLCVPVLTLARLAADCRAALKPGALVTDVGSTKAAVARQMRTALRGSRAVFVGSHPIAGSEQQGLDAARADLYAGATVILTPEPAAPPSAVSMLQRFWERLGAHVARMTPAEHDRVLARTSHLPHVVAAALAATVGRNGDPSGLRAFCGPGFRDTTRVAEGSPEVWIDILRSNRAAVRAELRACRAQLARFAAALDAGDSAALHCLLAQAGQRRRALVRRG